MFHHREDRIRSHSQLCWLALLLIRVVENATADTWRNTRHELDRMALVAFATDHGRVAQRSTLTPAHPRSQDHPLRARAARPALASLGEGRATRKRIAHVIGLAGPAGRLPCLEHGRDQHLTFWNQGSHGQLPPGVDLEATIDAAARSCAELAAHDWSVR